MNITGSRDGKVFFIDDDKVMIDGKMYYEKAPQNLPKVDAYSLLADVRAVEKALEIMDELIKYHAHYCDVEMPDEKAIREKAVKAIQKISKHFS